MISFSNVVTNLLSSATDLTAVNTAEFGSIDKLDANQQNAQYPYVFFRPVTSPGIRFGQPMIGGRFLNFEMYVMDVPKLTDTDMTDVMSNCEQIGYDICSKFYDGEPDFESTYTLSVTNLIPLFEAFQDRVGGWVFNLTIETDANGITNCNRV